MQLIWEHAAEEWDPFSLVGTIQVQGTCGSIVHDDCITLDCWLVAFAQGLLKLRTGELNRRPPAGLTVIPRKFSS